jgi:transcription initiation factor TFIID subunit 5
MLASGGADETVRLWDVSSGGRLGDGGSGDTAAGVSGASAGAGGARGGRRAGGREGPVRTLRTKSTPVFKVQFTRRNLLLAMGARAPTQQPQ